jgi:thioredoxin 2
MNDTNKVIIRCTGCGAANRIPADRISMAAKCGKCHEPLPAPGKNTDRDETYKMRCNQCGAKNRIPSSKLEAGPKCGKCGEQLQTEELFAPQPIMVTDANFDSQILKSPLPVLMWAWAPW